MPVKSKVKISQNFVAFSEYMNFKGVGPIVLSVHLPLVFFVLYITGSQEKVSMTAPCPILHVIVTIELKS